jgi:hypothetical protein
MNVVSRLGLVLLVIFGADSVVYWYMQHEHEAFGLLIMTAVSFGILGLYAALSLRAARRGAGAAAEAAEEEEPHIGPTIWPFVFSISAALITVGILALRWVLVPGALVFAAAAVGWIREARMQWRHPEHRPADAISGPQTDAPPPG